MATLGLVGGGAAVKYGVKRYLDAAPDPQPPPETASNRIEVAREQAVQGVVEYMRVVSTDECMAAQIDDALQKFAHDKVQAQLDEIRGILAERSGGSAE